MRALRACTILLLTAACGGDPEPDAYGNFEATEVVVSAQAGGQLLQFAPVEGMRLVRGAIVAQIDTAQPALEREQVVAQRQATAARTSEAMEQVGVLTVQRDVARRNLDRTRRLFEAQAATAQQLDQAEREYRVLVAQIEAARAQQQSVGREVSAADARVAQIRERLERSQVVNPTTGTVLATYVTAGEVVAPGARLYRVADLDTLTLRAYIDGSQLATVRIGQAVQVTVDHGDDRRRLPGTLAWVSPEAEFTPTPVQTRDERADLVYAIKVRVPNPDGILKIGMPADVLLAAAAERR